MGEAAFVDGDAGAGDAILQLALELLADHLGVAAQGHLLMLEIVIGIAGADRADRAFDLDLDELHVIGDVEQGLGGVGHPPDDVGRDLDRIAAQVVHLDLVRGDVVDAGRDLGAGQPGQHPAQAVRPVGALIGAEQQDRRRLVGLEQIEAAQHEQEAERADRRSERAPSAIIVAGSSTATPPADERRGKPAARAA